MWKRITGGAALLAALAACHFAALQFDPAALNQQNLYWIFSSSAQSIAAYVAFMLAGYALFHSMMTEVANSDDSLSEIVAAERRTIFTRLRLLLISTGMSLLLNLLMLFLNDWQVGYKNDLIALTFAMTAATVVLGLFIVMYMIDPRRNIRVARHLVRTNPQFRPTGQAQPAQTFFTRFVSLERRLRAFVAANEIGLQARPGHVATFRDLANALYYAEHIHRETLDRLLGVGNYRNLLFHGEIPEASQPMIEELNELLEELEENIPGF